MSRRTRWMLATLILLTAAIGGCDCHSHDVMKPVVPAANSDIPPNPSGPAPAPTRNNLVPTGTFAAGPVGNPNRITLNLLGLLDPSGAPITLGADHVWVSEDGGLRGCKITPAADAGALPVDLVFVIDDSSSMSEEADSVAIKVADFAVKLAGSGIDLRAGCVGFGYNSDQKVYGALDLARAADLQTYLTGPGRTGRGRTVGYGGPDAAALLAAAPNYTVSGGGENGIVGIRFADRQFAWRAGANRVYVLFTDEPTQPGGKTDWASARLIQDFAPGSGRGTIHAVFSGDTTAFAWQNFTRERPWMLAAGTGGTRAFIAPNAHDLDLNRLPVTHAIAASSRIEFLSSDASVAHDVEVTVITPTADGRTKFAGVLYR